MCQGFRAVNETSRSIRRRPRSTSIESACLCFHTLKFKVTLKMLNILWNRVDLENVGRLWECEQSCKFGAVWRWINTSKNHYHSSVCKGDDEEYIWSQDTMDINVTILMFPTPIFSWNMVTCKASVNVWDWILAIVLGFQCDGFYQLIYPHRFSGGQRKKFKLFTCIEYGFFTWLFPLAFFPVMAATPTSLYI